MRKILAFTAIILIISLILSFTVLASEKEAGKHEKEASWRVPGWQSVFALLAIIYYFVVSLNFLPKIASRKVEGKTDG